VRADLDTGRDRKHRVSRAAIVATLRQVFANRRLVELTLLSFFYSATQVSLSSFAVVYLAEELGTPLVIAGAGLSVATVAGVVGRIAWGHVADRTRASATVLAVIGIAAGLCAMATAAWPAGATIWPLFAILALFGGTAIGWNGVMLAEVARLAPIGRAGAITGATGFITFAGVVFGPSVFSLLAAVSGSYRTGFVVIGGASLVAATVFLLHARRAQTASASKA
jgi:sugar phosphate permease